MNVNTEPRKKTIKVKARFPASVRRRTTRIAMKPKKQVKKILNRTEEDPLDQLRAIRRYLTKLVNGLDDMDEVNTISMTFSYLSLGIVDAFVPFEDLFEKAKSSNIDELANLFGAVGISNNNVSMNGNTTVKTLKSKYPVLFNKDRALENPFETIQQFLEFMDVFLPKAKLVRNSNAAVQSNQQAFATRVVAEIQTSIEENSSEIREATAEVSTDAEDELADLMKTLGI